LAQQDETWELFGVTVSKSDGCEKTWLPCQKIKTSFCRFFFETMPQPCLKVATMTVMCTINACDSCDNYQILIVDVPEAQQHA
jgi:hypothetical protein